MASLKELLKVAKLGASRRHVAATHMNDRSSRSHSIFSITVRHVDPCDGAVFTGTLHLVDLAGSERQPASINDSQRVAEARTINRSLSTLGNVIEALARNTDDRCEALSHVPYRNSKLTWLLREALGGSAQAVLVIAISPSMVDRPETLSSLRFGSRAMCVANQPKAHVQAPMLLTPLLRSTGAGSEDELSDEWKQNHSSSASTASTVESVSVCSPYSIAGGDEEESKASDSDDHDREIDVVANALLQAFGAAGAAAF